jgi:hypothetical protein
MVGMKGISINVPDEQQTKLWIIENVKDGQMYTINIDTKQCDKTTNPIKLMECIPGKLSLIDFRNSYLKYSIDSATYIQSSMYGYGNKQIIGDTWLIKIDGSINYSTVSRDDCVPLTSHIFLQQPGKLLFYRSNYLLFILAMVNALTTTDFVPHIDDPSVFDIPPECQHLL